MCDGKLYSLKQWSKTYGSVMTVYLGSQRMVVLVGYDAVKEALVDQAEHFTGRAPIPFLNKVLRGYGEINVKTDVVSLMEFILNFDTSYMFVGLAISNGDRWRQLRRFTLTTLRDFGMGRKRMEEWIQEESRHLLKSFEETKCERREHLTLPTHEFITTAMIHILHLQLSELCDKIFSPAATPVDPAFFLSRAVSNVICSLVLASALIMKTKTSCTCSRSSPGSCALSAAPRVR